MPTKSPTTAEASAPAPHAPSGGWPRRRPAGPVAAALAAVTALAAVVALASGPVPLSLAEVLEALAGAPEASPLARTIVWELRLPRALGALGAGACLALAGALLQGLFRNALADPALTGVTAGAGLAAVLLLVAGPAALVLGPATLPAAAVLGGTAAAAAAWMLAAGEGRASLARLLLAGLCLNALCGAAVGLVLSLANAAAAQGFLFWSLGSLARLGWGEASVLLGLGAGGALAATALLARPLNALMLGEGAAFAGGHRPAAVRAAVIAAAALLAGATVAWTGTIGFVGLVAPHLARMLCGPDHRHLLGLAALLGGLLLLLADTAARSVAPPLELPVGALCALVGGPFFIALLRGSKSLP